MFSLDRRTPFVHVLKSRVPFKQYHCEEAQMQQVSAQEAYPTLSILGYEGPVTTGSGASSRCSHHAAPDHRVQGVDLLFSRFVACNASYFSWTKSAIVLGRGRPLC